jgi:hypothetical protein
MSLNRKAFEEWASGKGHIVRRTGARYDAHMTQALWDAWQASATHWAAWAAMRNPRNIEPLRAVLGDEP